MLLAEVSQAHQPLPTRTENPQSYYLSSGPPLNWSDLVLLALAQADSSFGSLGFTLEKEEHADELKIQTAECRGGLPFLEGSRPSTGMCATVSVLP